MRPSFATHLRFRLSLSLASLAPLVLACFAVRAGADPLEWSRWPMPYPRTDHAAIFDPVRNRMLIHGGFTLGPDNNSSELWALALTGTPRWEWHGEGGGLPRIGHVAVYDSVGDRMVLWGGTNDGVGLDGVWQLALGSDTWSGLAESGTAPDPRFHGDAT